MKAVNLDLVHTEHPLYAKLQSMGMPANKTEQYRNFAIKPLLAQKYHFYNPEKSVPKEGEKLVITNGSVSEFPSGVQVRYESDFVCDNAHYDVLYFYSHAVSVQTIYVEVTRESRFELEHICNQAETFLPYRIVISTAKNIHVEIFETFRFDASEQSFVLYGLDAFVNTDTTLRWIRNASINQAQAKLVGTHRFDVAREGALELNTFDFGDANALHLYKIDLAEHAWSRAAHLLYANTQARSGNIIAINHNEVYAKSAQEARYILADEAVGIFDSKIRVDAGAQHSHAVQNSKAILLSPHAHMYAKPQLEIYIDELEASHGATIGELDADALFYLNSRGIEAEEARKILVLAFAQSLIDSIGSSHYVEKINQAFEAAYYKKEQ